MCTNWRTRNLRQERWLAGPGGLLQRGRKGLNGRGLYRNGQGLSVRLSLLEFPLQLLHLQDELRHLLLVLLLHILDDLLVLVAEGDQLLVSLLDLGLVLVEVHLDHLLLLSDGLDLLLKPLDLVPLLSVLFR